MISRCPLLLIFCVACIGVLPRQVASFADESANKPSSLGGAVAKAAPQAAQIAQVPAGLAIGAQGTQVTELQKNLKLLGYFEGEVTGVYEESTVEAVSQFQKATSLPGATQIAQAGEAPRSTQKSQQNSWVLPGVVGGSLLMASLLGALVLRGRKAAVLAPEGDGSIVEFRSRPEQPPGESLPLPETARRENGRVSVSTSEDLSDGMAVEGKAKGKAGFNGHSHSTIAISENPSPQVESALSHIAESPKVPETTKISETTRLAKINIVDELIRDLRTPDPVKRQKVIWELGQRGDTRAVQPMVDLMVDSDSKQRSLILSALSEIGTRTLKPLSRALAISLQDESADVRKNAIRDLTRVYDMVAQISHLLHKATDDPDQDVQETARWALGQLNRIRTAPGVDNLPALKNSVSSPESLP